MSLAAALLLLASTGSQGVSLPLASSPELTRIFRHGECTYGPSSDTDAMAAVKDVAARFNTALTCGDLATAQELVTADGTVSELEEYIGEDGAPVRWIGTGPWTEQLPLFSNAASRASSDSRETVWLGEATVLLDGASALVRQPIQSETTGKPAMAVCMIQHMMLANDGKGWKIRHMMLVPDDAGCRTSAAAQ